MSDPTSSTTPLTSEMESLICKEIRKSLRSFVSEEVAREEDRKYRHLKWLIAIVGLVGLGTFSTLVNTFIEKTVESRVESRIGPISEAFEFYNLSTMATQIETSKAFSDEDKDSIMDYLRATAKNDRVRSKKEFRAALVKVAGSFASAEQSAAIDEIYQLYENIILNSPELVEILLHHYGQIITTRPSAPKGDTSLATFEKLEQAGHHKSPELCIYYRMLYSFITTGRKHTDATKGLAEKSLNLNEQDMGIFLRNLLRRSSAGNWQIKPDQQGKELQAITRDFLRVYAQDLGNMYGISPDLFRKISERGVTESEAKNFAGIIVGNMKTKDGAQ